MIQYDGYLSLSSPGVGRQDHARHSVCLFLGLNKNCVKTCIKCATKSRECKKPDRRMTCVAPVSEDGVDHCGTDFGGLSGGAVWQQGPQWVLGEGSWPCG